MREVDMGGGGNAYYVYNAAGERVRKVCEHSGIIEERIYLGGYEVYRRREGAQAQLVLERETLHVMDDARRIALVETKTLDTSVPPFTPTPRLRYQLGNHLGSAMLELEQAGLMISYEEYHPNGTTAYHAARSGVEVSAKRYRYTGKERDEETGLYHHGARYYTPWLGRWVSADPLGLADGVNLYAYARGNPIGHRDPSGTQTEVWQTIDTGDAICHRVYVHEETASETGFWDFCEEKPSPYKPSVSTKAPQPAVTSAQPDQGKAPGILDQLRHSQVGQGALGLVYGTIQAFTPGGFLAPSPAPHSPVFEFFRGAGETAAGLAQVFSGATLISGGGGAAAGGIAAAPVSAGAGLLVSALGGTALTAGIAAAAQGFSNVAAGIGTMIHAMSISEPGSGSPSSPPMASAQAAPPSTGGSTSARPSVRLPLQEARGLKGKEFEGFLTKHLGGTGPFKVQGREFDGGVGQRWWEAKSGNYWKILEDPSQLNKFRSDMVARSKIAKAHGATYELFSNTPIPEHIKAWLTKKGIHFTDLQ
jgi:RHS repeat-associated protein